MSKEPIQIERTITIEDRSEEIHDYVYTVTRDRLLNAIQRQGLTDVKTLGATTIEATIKNEALTLGKWHGKVPNDELAPQQAYFKRRYESTPVQHARDTMTHFIHVLTDYCRGIGEEIPSTHRPWDEGLEVATELLRSDMEARITEQLHYTYDDLLDALRGIYNYSYMEIEYIGGNEGMFDGVFKKHNAALTELGWDKNTIKNFRTSIGWHKYCDKKMDKNSPHAMLNYIIDVAQSYRSIDLDGIVGEMKFERETDYDGQKLRIKNWFDKLMLEYTASLEEEE
tara:strand:+ start:153 stop:1001 length:849 start_codon:yes stop_codon:yes gene_type:complete